MHHLHHLHWLHSCKPVRGLAFGYALCIVQTPGYTPAQGRPMALLLDIVETFCQCPVQVCLMEVTDYAPCVFCEVCIVWASGYCSSAIWEFLSVPCSF
jgi:hypothetical protein